MPIVPAQTNKRLPSPRTPRFARKLLSTLLATTVIFSSQSIAQTGAETVKKSYSIPAGPLGRTLSNVAASAGIPLAFDPALTNGLKSAAVSGNYSALEAMQHVLAKSGLVLSQRADGSYQLIKKVSAATNQRSSLTPIIVTGEKINRRLEDTLSSVAVMTQLDLEENADQTLTQVMMRTPGVYSQSGNDNWGIRGVPASGFDDQGPVTVNGAVSVYVDGIVQPQRLVGVNPLPLWDVNQVEIYRGPQSTVQGRNALAGAVVINTNLPDYEPELEAQVNTGNHGQQGLSLLAGGALVDDVVAVRLALGYQDTDGYIDNTTLNKDAFKQRNFSARGKMLIQPTDDLDILFTLVRTEYDRGENVVSADNGVPRYYEVAYNTDAVSGIDENAFSAKVDYRIDERWTLASLTTGQTTDYYSLLDFDQGPTINQEVKRDHDQDAYSQELRLGYQSDNLRGHVGVYFNELNMDTRDTVTSDGFGILDSIGDTDISSRAIFGELNWDFAERWQLITGLRYDYEENETQVSYPADLLGLAVAPSATVTDDYNALLPKLGVSYELIDNQLFGFVVQRGYRAGGVHLRPTALHETYDSEFTTNYELSYRGAWLDKRLRTSANLYYTDWEDQQVRIRDDNNLLRIVNAASSEMQGIELSAEFDLTDVVTLNADASFNDTEYKNFVSDAGDLSGQTFLYAPEYKFSLGATYRPDSKLTANVNATYQSDSPSAYETDSSGQVINTRRSDSVTLVNATLNYQLNDNLSVSAYVKNLFDERYITNHQGADQVDVGAPRLFGLAFKARM